MLLFGKRNKTPFRSEISNILDVHPETAQFFFHQAEKAFESSVGVYRSLSDKALKLSTFAVAFLTIFLSMFSYVVKSSSILDKGLYLWPLGTVVGLISLALLSFSVAYNPGKLAIVGADPKDIMKPEFVKDQEKPDQTVQLVFAMAQTYVNGADSNIEKSNFKSLLIKLGMWCFYLSPFIGFAVYLFYRG